jgi:hypothetical protein
MLVKQRRAWRLLGRGLSEEVTCEHRPEGGVCGSPERLQGESIPGRQDEQSGVGGAWHLLHLWSLLI